MKSVAIIVVTYNRLNLLKECIQSLKNQTYDDRDIIVINNGSTDGTQEWLESQDDVITITQENLGGAGGFYTGLKYSCENGYDYSWVMDDDVIATPNALIELIRVCPNVDGFVSSRVLDINGKMCNVPKITTKKSTNTGEPTWGNYLDINILELDVASFVSVLIPNKVIFNLGLPYKEYFIWGDDSEYTQRISSRYNCYMAINSKIVHKRAINGILSIFKEKNPNRINNYYFAYRNRIHLSKGLFNKTKYFMSGLYDFVRLLFLGRLNASYIALKGNISGIFFNPQIKYPSKG